MNALLHMLFGAPSNPSRPALSVPPAPRPVVSPSPSHAGSAGAPHRHGFPPARPQAYRAPYHGPDLTGLVGFHDTAFVIARPAAPHAAWLQERTASLASKVGGSRTNLTAGLRQSIELLIHSPGGTFRKIWLLTDGQPNAETETLWAVVDLARRERININTIGFGNEGDYDRALLERIAKATHNGQFIPVANLRQLTDAFIGRPDASPRRGRPRARRAETAILALDLSPSMNSPMEGRTKVQILEEAVLRLLAYKQRLFS